ncbi:hypothetical protein MSAN_00102800 [Mycena sanguinolenta]|uniref:Epidermal growth factor receptor-like transmembrane-juxtamembrane segment domain-containing protein n=1 Tax=Mycena sanguinolenta TaxID=230812 RepID=A0A8H6ZDB8_9AGAR|nr:hypothetical protein MSAN_00102800 [Mycena sanguinolenta]
MNIPPLRRLIVDDTDLDIQYEPNGWFVADPSTLTAGNYGPIYKESSHATTSNASLTFSFNGTEIEVRGTIKISKNSTTNVTDPTWDCFVDGEKISNPDPTFQLPQNNWLLCEQSTLAEGSHVLTVQVQSKGRPFYFDYLKYMPPPDASFETAVLCYPNTDPSLSFSSGWRSLVDGAKVTNEYGSQVTLSFQGTSVMSFGTIPNGVPQNKTWATYTIDGGQPVNFTLNGLASPQSTTEYFAPLFTTPAVPSANHSLVITYGGDDQHTPLTVQGFYVTNTSTVAESSSPESSSTPSPSAPPASSSTKHTSSGAVTGGVVGGIVFLALLAALAFFYSKRRRQRRLDFTSANPYPMSMANNDAHVNRQPYRYHPVTDIASQSKRGATIAASSSTGFRTKYPYIERLAPAPQQQSNSVPPAVVLVHEDSGVRLSPERALEPQIVELPPGYSLN